jgi:hypothetical protein
MFSRTYFAIAHRERGGVSRYLDSRRTRVKFRRDANDWAKVTIRAAETLQKEDPMWRENSRINPKH